MPAVVRPHRQLVNDEFVAQLEEFHGQQPGHPELGRYGKPGPLGRSGRLGI